MSNSKNCMNCFWWTAESIEHGETYGTCRCFTEDNSNNRYGSSTLSDDCSDCEFFEAIITYDEGGNRRHSMGIIHNRLEHGLQIEITLPEALRLTEGE